MTNGLELVERLIEQGGNYIAERIEGGVRFLPTSSRANDLASFEQLVRRLLDRNSMAYAVERTASGELDGLVIRLGR